ncbi:LuxR family transcriptional regulator [Pararhizobium haloflavum]|uniref:LuxR family transcriptional regulator n=1 Tax=Pararhizobium haloflavum TaxID=2037914 RepID=UPI001FE211B1|nr:LuxR family transcriptional regulator [Pararhizobium haloflavum]
MAEIETLNSQFEVFRYLKAAAERFGYRSFLVLRLPSPTSFDLNENSVITNWAAEFLAAYDRMQLFRDCPAVGRMRHSIVPFDFTFASIAEGQTPGRVEPARALFAEYGFVTGACFPVSDAKGVRGALILAGDRPALDPRELAELTLLSVRIYQRLVEVTATERRQEQPLTERELDCLTWTAAGKTSADIAAILSLSEHTVNHYLNRAARKLDTVNRTQAVAKALRQGLIT